MGRNKRKHIAEESLQIIADGRYTNSQRTDVCIRALLDKSKQGTRLFRPADLLELDLPTGEFDTQIQIRNETTFAGARALVEAGATEVCSLNFASAKNPGGGFLGGSQAQEEALCRASGLYDTLLAAPEYYEFHRAGGSALYSHHMIYSPDVPVFRNDEDELIDDPWCTSVITSPAVNAGALRRNDPELVGRIGSEMEDRIDHVMTVAACMGHRNLVLGAWGCGVFQNDPIQIAGLFASLLNSKRFRGVFQRVRFSVLDNTKGLATFAAFENEVSHGSRC